MEKRYTCPSCGALNSEEDLHCSQCGMPLGQVAPGQGVGAAIHSQETAASGGGFRRFLKQLKRTLGLGGEESPSTPAPLPQRQGNTQVLTGRPESGPAPAPGMLAAGAPTQSASRSSMPTPPAAPMPAPAVSQPASRSGGAPHSIPAAQSAAPVVMKPFAPGAIFNQRYHIVAPRQLSYSVYYDAVDLMCPNLECQQHHLAFPPNGLCSRCHATMDTVLIHERPSQGNGFSPVKGSTLISISRVDHPNILPHREMLAFSQALFTVVEHPGRWGVLVRGRRQRSSDEVLFLVSQVGHALTHLHQQGYAFVGPGESVFQSMERLVTYGADGGVKVADLSSCVQLTGDGRSQIGRDIVFLGQMLLFISAGVQPTLSNLDKAPPEQRPFVERALHGRYPSIPAMLNDLSGAPEPAPAARALKPFHGQATDPGRRHSHNEDAVATFTFDKQQQGGAVPIGFYMVADGMGGHDAGDVASRMVYQVVTEWILKTKVLPDLRQTTRKLTTDSVPAEQLRQAVTEANEALLRHARAQNSNLGSTATMALIIGNVATVANVGDSRTYLLRDGQLRPITRDHSLVARLVAANVITPEDVRSHPQRNQIYRSLGHQPDVEVDTFTVPLRRGDRVVLCCDGLWEMLLDEEIKQIIEGSRSPQEACDALVTAANRAGGEDNISVIVVEMG
ncbi:MAG: protein phosphatase 2C domain-containing protein [Anaerolineae bacterium]|nr:protein phosphatase 2C domain-containing protein [Anaerolineae bacterium]